jgi:hypothetical protein
MQRRQVDERAVAVIGHQAPLHYRAVPAGVADLGIGRLFALVSGYHRCAIAAEVDDPIGQGSGPAKGPGDRGVGWP